MGTRTTASAEADAVVVEGALNLEDDLRTELQDALIAIAGDVAGGGTVAGDIRRGVITVDDAGDCDSVRVRVVEDVVRFTPEL